MRSVFGSFKQQHEITTWIRSGGRSVCLVSGPPGCGKTSMAHAVFKDAGYQPVDVRSEPGDMLSLFQDLIRTPPSKLSGKVGVVMDEMENLSGTDRSKVVKLLQTAPTVPVICICSDAKDRVMSSLVKLCSPKICMTRAAPNVVVSLLDKIAPDVSPGPIMYACNGDLRQAVMMAGEIQVRERVLRSFQITRSLSEFDAEGHERKTPNTAITSMKHDSMDIRIPTIYDATTRVFTADVQSAVEAMRYDHLIPIMTHTSLVDRLSGGGDIDDLSRRLDFMSDGDLLDTHSSHQTHEHASYRFVNACLNVKGRSRPAFPSAFFKPRKSHDRMAELVNVLDTTFVGPYDRMMHVFLPKKESREFTKMLLK